jgi:N-acetylglutamate synthase-like GNAT family acetyltransferase
MGLKQIDHGTEQYLQMVNLRDNLLRRPLGLTFSHDELLKEKDDIHIVCMEEEKMLGCCILTALDNNTARLRQMAVANNLQGKGVGASIMSFAESLATDKGFKKIILHSRDSVIGFYEKFGYRIQGNQFIEVNLPHHIMEKNLA